MLLRQLTYYVALAREGHFARATATCEVPQPTRSVAIKKLEQDLDVQLVIRATRFVGLNPEGERALAWRKQVLGHCDEMLRDLDAGQRSGRRTETFPLSRPQHPAAQAMSS